MSRTIEIDGKKSVEGTSIKMVVRSPKGLFSFSPKNADIINFYEIFFLKIEDIHETYLCTKFELILDKDSRNYKHFKFLTSKITIISMAMDTKIQ